MYINIIFQTGSNNKIIEALITAGADPNAEDRFGTTALIFAVLRGNEDAVDELLKCQELNVCVSLHKTILLHTLYLMSLTFQKFKFTKC